MKTKLISTAVAAMLGFFANYALAQDVQAQEEASSPLSTTLTFASDYRFRGISQNLNNPVLQLSTTFTTDSGVYLGIFGSNVDFGGAVGANLEVDLFAGWTGELSEGLTGDVQIVRYYYPGEDIPISYTELLGTLSYAGFSGSVGYSNDVFNTNETGVYYNIGYQLALGDEYTVSTSIGYYNLDDAPDYGGGIVDKSIGVSREFGPLTLDISYFATNKAFEDIYGETNDTGFAVSMSTSF